MQCYILGFLNANIMQTKEKYCERYELCREDNPCEKQCNLCKNWDNRRIEGGTEV